MSIWFNKSEKNLSKTKIEEFLNKWVEILDIDSSKLKVIGVEKQFEIYNTHSANATVYWDHDECIWKLTLNRTVSERDIIHELGHIKLESDLNFRSYIPKDEDENLILCLKLLMDSIVNYNLS